MKVSKILFSQALRYLRISGPAGGNIYGVELARAMESRYGFLEGPRTVADFSLERGVTFLHGFYHREFVIDKLSIFQTGLVAESKTPTERCDEFLDDVVAWARQMGISAEPFESAPGYVSHLEVISDSSLETIDKLTPIAAQLTAILRSYGYPVVKFEVSSASVHTDLTNAPYPKPLAFSFARRDEQPYPSNIYFSTAPLRTTDHMIVLETLDEILSKTSVSAPPA
jgi:hypothetical protein